MPKHSLSGAFLFLLGFELMLLPVSYQSALASPSLQILDPATSPITPINDISDISNDAFGAFANGALSAVEDAFDQYEQIEILLIRIPVVASGDDDLVIPNLNVDPGSAQCSISSPWAEFAFSTDGSSRASGTLIWNERQLLIDASADGTHHSPAPRRPYTRSEFENYAQMYGRALSSQETDTLLRSGLPEDLAQLFRRSPQSTLIPFSENARATIPKIASESVASHVEVVARLVALCTSGEAGEYRFSHLTEVPG
jgi:hypothetical protein